MSVSEWVSEHCVGKTREEAKQQNLAHLFDLPINSQKHCFSMELTVVYT